MSQAMTVYATEEDVVLAAPADFAALCPLEQALAAGADGRFLAGERWVLRSTSVDFAAQGVSAGCVARLRLGMGPLPSPGELFVVAGVSTGSVALRRAGQPDGVGQPPAPAGGLEGVDFLVVSLGPQLRASSREVGRRLGLVAADGSPRDPGAGREVLRELVVADVLRVLHEARGGASGEGAPWHAGRASSYREAFEGRMARLVGLGERGGEGGVGRYRARLSR
jgi:hypothetical protein